eukprot:TRINITY_DN6587_c0_g1_i1.p1 TRINITY_DN6587_c0_g1~~TRINITY_DN6587_c0_g1_i1.p1  ORF type:complete len:308 (+),score=54.68 TRINITY_DN6587_c0_g1_i1:327-1250(+)
MVSNETRDSVCPFIDPKHTESYRCANDTDCKADAGKFIPSQNWQWAGKCLLQNGTGYCGVRGWCADVGSDNVGVLPFNPSAPWKLVHGVRQWSLLLRLNYAFPAFGITLNSAASGLLPGQNQWQIGDILEKAGVDFTAAAAEGAIVLMDAKFDCNLNVGSDEDCKPDWEFSRLDKTPAFSTGFNHYQTQYSPSQRNNRLVTKRFGLKIEFTVSGRAGKFSLVNLLIALGSGLALVSVASLVTDWILSNLWSKRDHYKRVRNASLDVAHLNIDPAYLKADLDESDGDVSHTDGATTWDVIDNLGTGTH